MSTYPGEMVERIPAPAARPRPFVERLRSLPASQAVAIPILLGLTVYAIQVLAFRDASWLLPLAAAGIAAGALVLVRTERRRQGQKRLAELGFQPLDLPIDELTPERVADAVADETLLSEIDGVWADYQRDESRRYLLSLGVWGGLEAGSRSPRPIGEELAAAVLERAVERIVRRTDASRATVEHDLPRALSIEVWRVPDATPGTVWYRFKRQLTFRDRASHFVSAPPGRLRQWDEIAPGQWRAKPVDRIPATSVVDVVIGPADYPTLVVDVVDSEIAGAFPVARLSEDPVLRERLSLSVTEYLGGWPLVRGTTTHQKGYLRLEGIVQDGSFVDLDELKESEHRTLLDRTVPNVLRRVAGTDAPVINPLLADLMPKSPPWVERTVRGNGNFVIEYAPVEDGSEQERYWLRGLAHAETRYWHPALGGVGLHRNPENYRPFDDGERALIPFSSGFLLTGVPGEPTWLCLELNVGSPGLATPARGVTRIETVDLKAVVRDFARRAGIEELDWQDGSHGVIAVGTRAGRRLWITLCEPRHVLRHNLKRTIDDLLEAGVLPPDAVERHHVDRQGRPTTPDEGLLVLVAPELEMVESILLAKSGDAVGESDLDVRRVLCRRLAAFAGAALAKDVLCVDFTLDQTALWEDRVFVCDYTAYVPRSYHRAGGPRKPEYTAPEEREGARSLQAEPYTVFTLGILFYQVLFAQPGARHLPFPAVLGVRPDDVETWRQEVRADLDARGPRAPGPLRGLVARMLDRDPAARPALSEVLRELDRG